MSIDKLVFILAMALGVPVLAYSLGYDDGHNKASQTCPAQDGRRVAYSVQQGPDLKCVYVTQRKGLV